MSTCSFSTQRWSEPRRGWLSCGPAGPQAGELRVLRVRRGELAAQLELLSRVIIAVRAAADPSGERL